MVAILILLVLAALSMGALKGVLERSLDVKCQSNLRQLALAGGFYIADKNGQLPDRGTWASSTGTESLVPYLGLRDSNGSGYAARMLCPAIAKSTFRPHEDRDQRSYSINQFATGSDNASANSRETWQTQVFARGAPLKLGRVANPAAQAFFIDGPMVPDKDAFRFSTFQSCDRLQPVVPDSSLWQTYYPHSQCVNVVFLDGHLERITEEKAREKLVGTSTGTPSPRTEPFWGATK
jgi:prepilin-type processing-associated H-X9-DG protein